MEQTPVYISYVEEFGDPTKRCPCSWVYPIWHCCCKHLYICQHARNNANFILRYVRNINVRSSAVHMKLVLASSLIKHDTSVFSRMCINFINDMIQKVLINTYAHFHTSTRARTINFPNTQSIPSSASCSLIYRIMCKCVHVCVSTDRICC